MVFKLLDVSEQVDENDRDKKRGGRPPLPSNVECNVMGVGLCLRTIVIYDVYDCIELQRW